MGVAIDEQAERRYVVYKNQFEDMFECLYYEQLVIPPLTLHNSPAVGGDHGQTVRKETCGIVSERPSFVKYC